MSSSLRKRCIRLISCAFITVLAVSIFVNHYKLSPLEIQKQSQIVEAKKMSKKCSNLVWFEHCYGKELARVTINESLSYAKETLTAIQGIDKRAYSCHVAAHYIADAYVKNHPSDWKNLLSFNGEDFCNYGYIHGMIDARKTYDKNFKLDEITMASLCQYVKNKTNVFYVEQECYHGFGHMLLAETRGDIDKALDVCKKVASIYQSSCSAGIFMEDFTKDNLVIIGVKKEVWDEKLVKKQEQLCSQYEGNEALGCWQVLAHLYGAVYKFVPATVYAQCNKAPQQTYKDRCNMRASSAMLQFSNESRLEDLCSPFKTNEHNYQNCIESIIDVALNTSVNFMNRSITMCNTVPMSNSLKETCYRRIGSVLKSRVNTKVQEKLCSPILEKNYRKLCIS